MNNGEPSSNTVRGTRTAGGLDNSGESLENECNRELGIETSSRSFLTMVIFLGGRTPSSLKTLGPEGRG